MTDQHLSEEIIQQYVLNKTSCGADTIAHMHECEYCREKAETYRLIFSEISHQPNPVFDFDIAKLVLPQLSAEKRIRSNYTFLFYFMGCFVIAGFGIAGYLYKNYLAGLFKKYIFSVSSGLSKGVLYLLLTAALFILIFQVVELYKKYQRKIDDLNFY